jgi:hypothetical protein
MVLKCALNAQIDKNRKNLTKMNQDNWAQLNNTNKANYLELNKATTDELLVHVLLLYQPTVDNCRPSDNYRPSHS